MSTRTSRPSAENSFKIFQSTAYLYMPIDGNDINDSLSSTVGCENMNYDYDYFEAY